MNVHEADKLDGFTKRTMMSVVLAVGELSEVTERLHILLFALADAHDIVQPKD